MNFQPKVNLTFICWPEDLQEESNNNLNKPFMYLKLENDETASFYKNDPESMEVRFKFNICHYPSPRVTLYFETYITDDLRSFLQRVDLRFDSDDSETKLKFYLYQDGHIGPCS